MSHKRIFPVLILLALFQLTGSQVNPATAAHPGRIQQVSAYPQPDSPLRVSVLLPKWEVSGDAKWQMLELSLRLENVSDKAIRAYAIRIFEGAIKSEGGHCSFSNITSAGGAIRPYQSRDHLVVGGGYPGLPRELFAAVDFVEFTDGSTWGEDVFESASRLAGQRAGAQAALVRFRELRTQVEIEELIRVIDKEAEQITTPSDQKEVWKDGYKSGAASIRERIKRAYKNGGAAAAGAELKKPFDTATDN